jgi:mannose-6-phosphate isomerase-like protein (cupin superfamily)
MLGGAMNINTTGHAGEQVGVSSVKPWGYEEIFCVAQNCALKVVTLNPNQTFSRQTHLEKEEIYHVTHGDGFLELGYPAVKVIKLSVGDSVLIPPRVIHQAYAGSYGLTIIEASTQEITDIARIEDSHGRPTASIDELNQFLKASKLPKIDPQDIRGVVIVHAALAAPDETWGYFGSFGIGDRIKFGEFVVRPKSTVPGPLIGMEDSILLVTCGMVQLDYLDEGFLKELFFGTAYRNPAGSKYELRTRDEGGRVFVVSTLEQGRTRNH